MLAHIAARLRRLARGEGGAISTEWAFITVGGGVVAILASGSVVGTNVRLSDTMRAEVGAPAPESVLEFEDLAAVEDVAQPCSHLHDGKMTAHPADHAHCQPGWTEQAQAPAPKPEPKPEPATQPKPPPSDDDDDDGGGDDD